MFFQIILIRQTGEAWGNSISSKVFIASPLTAYSWIFLEKYAMYWGADVQYSREPHRKIHKKLKHKGSFQS